MTKTLNIIGAGLTLNRIPADHVFKNDTLVLNVSIIAPQFYDYDADTFHHSWTYSMMVDPAIAKPYYFPEYLYFRAAMNNHDGTTYASTALFNRNKLPVPVGVKLMPDIKYQQVILPALELAKHLNYERVILIACPYCSMGKDSLQRYWWEDADYCDRIIKHPKNRGAVKAEGVKVQRVTRSGKHIDALNRKNTTATYLKEIDTGMNDVRVTRFQKKQKLALMSKIKQIRGAGFEVFKYGDYGMLDIPVMDNLDEL